MLCNLNLVFHFEYFVSDYLRAAGAAVAPTYGTAAVGDPVQVLGGRLQGFQHLGGQLQGFQYLEGKLGHCRLIRLLYVGSCAAEETHICVMFLLSNQIKNSIQSNRVISSGGVEISSGLLENWFSIDYQCQN